MFNIPGIFTFGFMQNDQRGITYDHEESIRYTTRERGKIMIHIQWAGQDDVVV